MTKILPGLPEADENDALFPALAPSQRPGMFGAGRRAQNPLIPAIPAASPTPYPFSPPSSAIGPDAIAGLLANPSAGSGLPLPAWARAGGEDGLFTGPDIQFLAPQTPAGTPHYRLPPPEVIAAAQASQRSTGVPASVSIAQWIYESGWGRHMPKDSNNFFGIKEPDLKKPGVVQETKEADPRTGEMVQKTQRFRKFSSPEESWAAHARLLSADPRYAKAMLLTHDPDRFVDTIAGTYAPNNRKYAANIKDTMKTNHLYQYDVLPPGQ
jgi:hypothetical protein